jgi:membrane protease YdiL (CAAX protease family)
MSSDRAVVAEYSKLPAYFLISYAVSWLFWVPLALSQLELVALEVPGLFFLLGGVGPITAATLLTWRALGSNGLRELYSRLLIWRVHWGWYLVALLWPSAVALIALAIARFTGIPAAVTVAPATAILLSLVGTTLILIIEEVGWRGYALPRLQSRHNALISSLVLGTLWGVWHFPLHLMPDYPRPLDNPFASIALFTIFAVLFSVLLTWIFNSTRGSLLLVLLGHQAFNTTNLRALKVEPFGPFMMLGFVVLTLFVALVVSIFGWRALSRRGRITVAEVHPGLTGG